MQKTSFYNKNSSRRKSRKFSEKPLAAYMARDWYGFIASKYLEIYGNKLPGYPNYKAECSIITNRIYQIAFYELLWGSRDFEKFLIKEIQYRKNQKQNFLLFLLGKPGSKNRFLLHDKSTQNKRQNDIFEYTIHISHEPLTSDQNDLMEILPLYNKKQIQFCYHYGLPIFHAYQRIENKEDFNSATNMVKNVLHKIIKKFKGNEKISRKVLSGIAENSIKWEPCVRGSEKKEKKFVLDWREEFRDIWEVYNITEERWWKESFSTKSQPILKPVKNLFDLVVKE